MTSKYQFFKNCLTDGVKIIFLTITALRFIYSFVKDDHHHDEHQLK